MEMSGSGLNLDNNGDPFEFSFEPLGADPSFSYELLAFTAEPTEIDASDLRGDVTFTLPDGITLLLI